MKKNDQLVCVCNVVSESEIRLLLKKGAQTTAEIQRLTAAGTSCGKCRALIDSIVKDFLRDQPADLQRKINFDF